MKNTILLLFFFLVFSSCQKIEEKISQTVDETTQKVKDKSNKIIQEKFDDKINETIKNLTNSEDIAFSKVFQNNTLQTLDSIKGKSLVLPTGSKVIIFKYKMEKKTLLEFLQSQPSTDNANSDKIAKKIDGQEILAKLKMAESFLPKELTDNPVFQSNKDNKSLEFFRLNRIPLQSTLIYNPKDSTFFHLVDAKIEK
ncbi:hypothetical protein [Frigoriflavimonas asaccharolytica]|uniref:Lipoprotein n=1 Tax=Frigoriflavimonas asaccharolytica TaxID=2735899 RepID=A0A8J8G9X5_9FLAO|nr:hypothetical protein [Frigoriflavimonas asaccharolytica]NRS92005.1 hypothetical protein [Frigoriflavimonas asaccharolytica]